MARKASLWTCMTIALSGTVFLPGCGGILKQAVIDGAYTFVSGGLSNTLSSSSTTSSLQNILGSLLFPGATTTTTDTSS